MNDKNGYVYVLSNPSMPELVKIGRSVNGGRNRGFDIYKQAGTAIPTPFNLEFEIWVDDCVEFEKEIHAELDRYRVNANREFFAIPVIYAINEILRMYAPKVDMVACVPDLAVTEEECGDILGRNYAELSNIGITHTAHLAAAIRFMSNELVLAACKDYMALVKKRQEELDFLRGIANA